MNGLLWQRRFDPLRDFQHELGRLLGTFEPLTTWRVPKAFPPINLYEHGDAYVLTTQLAGVDPNEVELTITGDALTLSGERRRLPGVAEDGYRRQERQYGRWTRTVTLPDRIESGQVTAGFADGILTVTLPKSESSKARQIPVTAQSS